MYGVAGNVNLVPDNTEIWNFNSLVEDYRFLNLLPPNNLGAASEYEFDNKYYEYIFTNNDTFVRFMNMIKCLYDGKNVYLIVYGDDYWSDNIVQSLLKLIQQRYGINATLVNTVEDVIYASNSKFDPYFGIANLDQDLDRYEFLYNKVQLMDNGGVVKAL